ncbi:MAG: DUF4189 domain-containing protein [Caulobacterales bacterium]|nr:DUF4189 domain-containing protein [Caulobacterales bacterium]MCA0372760.1 DUF4189 domain-containing protein [Pseudomonadota bacterium]
MRLFIKLGIVIFTLIGINAYAEGGCPAGSYPIGGGNGGWQGCAPIPNYNSSGGQTYSNPGRWLDSYGSLYWAKNKDGGDTYAYSVKKDNVSIADNDAYNACVNAGFTNCQKAMDFVNAYLAIATDDTGAMWAASNGKENKAKKTALDSCKKYNGKNCKIYTTANSRPDWVK